MDALAVIALAALGFGPVLFLLGDPDSVGWRRGALVAAALLTVHYLAWRLTNTVPWGDWTAAGLYMQIVAAFEVAWLAEMAQAYAFFWSAERPTRGGHLASVHAGLERATIDVFIPTLNEGEEILERTVLAARRIAWQGAVRIFVLDDGRRQWVGELCRKHGVRWITRADNRGAKAGNLNHALGQTDGDFILILDADFLAHPEAIRRLMPPMGDSSVAITQAPQHVYNPDPVMRALGTAGAFGDEQRLFFDRILPARDASGVAFCCGSCALIRRSALLAVGGVPRGSVTEDILLSLLLRQHGWETRVIDAPVAIGLAPETLHAFFVQRCRWARGAIQLMYLRTGLLARKLRLKDRFAFFPAYWLSSLVRASSLVIPQLYLLFGWAPLQNAPVAELVRHQAPLLIAVFALPALLYRRRWSPLVNLVWNDIIALRLVPNVLRDLALPFRDTRFQVTPKGRKARGALGGEWMGVAIAALTVLTLLALIVGPYGRWDDPFVSVSMFWSVFALARLLAMLCVVWSAAPSLEDPKIGVRCTNERALVLVSGSREIWLAGWWIGEDRIVPPSAEHEVPAGRLVRPHGRDAHVPIAARVQPGGKLEFANDSARGAFLSMLVAMRLDQQIPYRPAVAIARITTRMFGFAGDSR
jgi:cellulose synthase (UDP-forming)